LDISLTLLGMQCLSNSVTSHCSVNSHICTKFKGSSYVWRSLSHSFVVAADLRSCEERQKHLLHLWFVDKNYATSHRVTFLHKGISCRYYRPYCTSLVVCGVFILTSLKGEMEGYKFFRNVGIYTE
jgi:hypothetical protein